MTATKTRGTNKFSTFAALEASGVFALPLKKRRPLVLGRKGKVVPRNFGLSEADLQELKGRHVEGDELPNPHNKGFSYFLIEALKGLGLDRNHSMKRVIERFRELASAEKDKATGKTFWQTFKNKPVRNESTGQNWLGRFNQNVEVLQRVPIGDRKNVTPYGLKLLRVGQQVLGTAGCVIDVVYGSSGDVMLRLNTNSAIPVNETKRSKVVATTAAAASLPLPVEPEVAPVVPEVAPEAPVTEPAQPVEVAAPAVAPVAAPEVQAEAPATEVAAPTVSVEAAVEMID